jgi:hypothetical protein
MAVAKLRLASEMTSHRGDIAPVIMTGLLRFSRTKLRADAQ